MVKRMLKGTYRVQYNGSKKLTVCVHVHSTGPAGMCYNSDL